MLLVWDEYCNFMIIMMYMILILHQANSLNVLGGCVKLPYPQPRTRTETYTQTGQRALRATQARAALSHAYATTYQKRIMDILKL
jgi:hypothetical protein